MSTIILKWSHSPDLIIFRYSCFKLGQSEPRVAYKSVAYKRKSVYLDPKTFLKALHGVCATTLGIRGCSMVPTPEETYRDDRERTD